ncbi:MAG: DNA mismatch repair endonuclease MutL, partial [Ardenticatenales bacterium]
MDDLSIARIAAGEVVERPASVVKELVENALDAGARRIDVRIDGGGLRRIEVEDDGGGIAADELALAFTRHATSKILSADDLETVVSLGFRGEALASIASVSHVTVVSRMPDEALGLRLRIDNGRPLGHEPTTAAVGTRLTVENLFNALPARLKFQKSEATEAGRVGEWLARLAFAHPHVAFSLARGARTTLRTIGDGDRRAVLAAVLGDDVAATLLEVDHAADGIRVHGLVGPPHVQRANRGGIALFAGGRWIQSPRLTHAVVEAYHALIPSGRYPVAWLQIDVPPETIDVNVHPAKIEVRFRHADAVWHAVQRAVRGAVTGLAPVAPLGAGFTALGVGHRSGGGGMRTGGAGASGEGRPAEPWPWARSDEPAGEGGAWRIADAL